MTYADINKMFTAEVSKYLACGYHFNTASMSGSQGETAKVDLTNGTEIIRVLLRTFSDGWDKQGTELFVGRVAEKENVRRDVAYCVNTIWNNQTIKIAVPFIRRKLGIKNVDKKRIEVFRTPDHRYIISYRGTGYQLNRKED